MEANWHCDNYGIDTISYRGEARAVTINLAAGTVHSNAANNAVVLPDPATTINNLAILAQEQGR